MVSEIFLQGYRSLRSIRFPLSQINIITGANGCGKSNVYRGLYLLAQAATGRLAHSLALEGGMPSALWAGPRLSTTSTKQPRRMTMGFATAEFSYEISLGLPQVSGSFFGLDPEVKEEHLWHGRVRRPSTTYMERKAGSVWVQDNEGTRISYPYYLDETASVLSQLQEPHLYPELASVRQMIQAWRFYHHFRTDHHAPLRLPQIGIRTPVISDDGNDLAAALQTIMEIGDHAGLDEMIDLAFPGCKVLVTGEQARFEILFSQPNIARPLGARELSDGTLRYLCLVAALKSPRPPKFMVLNEPETSLHPDLIPPLAQLLERAAQDSQIWITTHSQKLIEALQRIATGISLFHLEKIEGRTEIAK